MAIGLGLYFASIASVVIILFILRGLSKLEQE
jgi:uncharacterized membrane protein YhiD involved in acid resistance